MEKKKTSMFDNIRVPLEDLTEEEEREMDNDPEFQAWSKKVTEELVTWQKNQKGENQSEK